MTVLADQRQLMLCANSQWQICHLDCLHRQQAANYAEAHGAAEGESCLTGETLQLSHFLLIVKGSLSNLCWSNVRRFTESKCGGVKAHFEGRVDKGLICERKVQAVTAVFFIYENEGSLTDSKWCYSCKSAARQYLSNENFTPVANYTGTLHVIRFRVHQW